MVSAERPRASDHEQDLITAALGLYVHKLNESDRDQGRAQEVPLNESVTEDLRLSVRVRRYSPRSGRQERRATKPTQLFAFYLFGKARAEEQLKGDETQRCKSSTFRTPRTETIFLSDPFPSEPLERYFLKRVQIRPSDLGKFHGDDVTLLERASIPHFSKLWPRFQVETGAGVKQYDKHVMPRVVEFGRIRPRTSESSSAKSNLKYDILPTTQKGMHKGRLYE